MVCHKEAFREKEKERWNKTRQDAKREEAEGEQSAHQPAAVEAAVFVLMEAIFGLSVPMINVKVE